MSSLTNSFAQRWHRSRVIYTGLLNPAWSSLSCLQLHHSFSRPVWGKAITGSSRLHSFHFGEERRGREDNLSSKLSVLGALSISNCVSLSPSSSLEWAGSAALATGSSEFSAEWKMSHRETWPPPPPPPSTPLHRHRHLGPPRPPTHLRITPDLFLCLYQSVEVRNTDESLWMCVYTPESRKEGNQPRSAKSGEVTENSCSVPELCTRFFYFTKATLISRCLTCEGFLSKDGRICRSEPFVKEMTKLWWT